MIRIRAFVGTLCIVPLFDVVLIVYRHKQLIGGQHNGVISGHRMSKCDLMLSQLQDIVILAYFYWLFVGPESD